MLGHIMHDDFDMLRCDINRLAHGLGDLFDQRPFLLYGTTFDQMNMNYRHNGPFRLLLENLNKLPVIKEGEAYERQKRTTAVLNTPDLKPAFAGSGRRPPEVDKALSITDMFKTVTVSLRAPDICQQLRAAKDDLIAKYSHKGAAHTVQLHFALQAMNNKVTTLIEGMSAGGPDGYENMQGARKYLSRLQKFGLDA